jgi:hypothetical protein
MCGGEVMLMLMVRQKEKKGGLIGDMSVVFGCEE